MIQLMDSYVCWDATLSNYVVSCNYRDASGSECYRVSQVEKPMLWVEAPIYEVITTQPGNCTCLGNGVVLASLVGFGSVWPKSRVVAKAKIVEPEPFWTKRVGVIFVSSDVELTLEGRDPGAILSQLGKDDHSLHNNYVMEVRQERENSIDLWEFPLPEDRKLTISRNSYGNTWSVSVVHLRI